MRLLLLVVDVVREEKSLGRLDGDSSDGGAQPRVSGSIKLQIQLPSRMPFIQLLLRCYGSPDLAEGFASFLQKRSPVCAS